MIYNPLIVIPSQVDDDGVPRKQLVDIHGTPMVVHSWRRAVESGIGCTMVDCLDEEIAETLEAEGAYAYRSEPDLQIKNHNYRTESGADRVAATVNRFDRFYNHDVIINLHDDLPALDPRYIRAMMYPLASLEVHVATLVCPLEPGEVEDPRVVKVTVDWHPTRKVYVLPGSKVGQVRGFGRDAAKAGPPPYFRHIPIYAYRRVALDRLVNLPPTDRELEERLEPLRALENGLRMDVALVDALPLDVDTEAEIETARALLDTAL